MCDSIAEGYDTVYVDEVRINTHDATTRAVTREYLVVLDKVDQVRGGTLRCRTA